MIEREPLQPSRLERIGTFVVPIAELSGLIGLMAILIGWWVATP